MGCCVGVLLIIGRRAFCRRRHRRMLLALLLVEMTGLTLYAYLHRVHIEAFLMRTVLQEVCTSPAT